MKGMNSTLILNEPDNQQSDTLQSIFNDSCSRHGVPDSQKDTLIKNGIDLFEMDTTGDIFPLSSYQTIAEYVVAHRGDIIQADDSTNLNKDQIYNQLVKAANDGRMSEYRRLKTLFSAAV